MPWYDSVNDATSAWGSIAWSGDWVTSQEKINVNNYNNYRFQFRIGRGAENIVAMAVRLQVYGRTYGVTGATPLYARVKIGDATAKSSAYSCTGGFGSWSTAKTICYVGRAAAGTTVYGQGGWSGNDTPYKGLDAPAYTTSYAVSYNANGGTGTTAGQTKVYNTALTLRSSGFSRTGYEFVRWNTKADGSGTSYNAGGSYTANAAVTLYAVWRATNSTILSVTSAVETQGAIDLQMDRKGSDHWHKATFSYDGTELLESAAFETALSTTVPRSWFSHSPNSAVMDVTLSVQTYTDSTCTTAIGDPVTATIHVTADTGVAPTVTAGWASAAPYNAGAAAVILDYVKNISRAEITFDATKVTHAYGAALASYSVSYKGESVSASPYRTGILTETSVTVVCKVTDSRGRSASESITLTVLDYSAPTISRTSIYHCLSDGTQDEGGSFLRVLARLGCASLNGANTVSATVAVAPKGGSYGAETAIVSDTPLILGSYSPDATWTVRIRATDTVGNVTVYEETVAARTWAMKFRPDGNGVAFGKAAETNATFEITESWAVKSKGIIDLIYPVGSIYMSVNNIDPAVLFGFGTWEAVTSDFYAWKRTV